MQLVANFNGISFNCYQDDMKSDDFWATREQIGQLLDYDNPRISIANIHNRHTERLDKFSWVIKLITPSGAQDATVYNFRGLLEICRYSSQPKADAVMDFLYDIADEIRKTGSYGKMSIAKEIKIILIKENQLALALDRVAQHYTGVSMLAISGTVLEAPAKHQLLTPTEIGKHFNMSAWKVNAILAEAGYQHKIGKNWEPLELGMSYAVMLDTNKKHSNGTPVRQLKWDSSILDIFERALAELITLEDPNEAE